MVVAEKAADTLKPLNAAGVTRVSDTIDQFVVEALMVAFAVIVNHELRERTTEMPFTEWNHAIQAFLSN